MYICFFLQFPLYIILGNGTDPTSGGHHLLSLTLLQRYVTFAPLSGWMIFIEEKRGVGKMIGSDILSGKVLKRMC